MFQAYCDDSLKPWNSWNRQSLTTGVLCLISSLIAAVSMNGDDVWNVVNLLLTFYSVWCKIKICITLNILAILLAINWVTTMTSNRRSRIYLLDVTCFLLNSILCSTSVKYAFFKTYCLCFYKIVQIALWQNYTATCLNRLKASYHKCGKEFFFCFTKKTDSMTDIFCSEFIIMSSGSLSYFRLSLINFHLWCMFFSVCSHSLCFKIFIRFLLDWF